MQTKLFEQLTGRRDDHLITYHNMLIDPQCLNYWQQLQQYLQKYSIQATIASAFRSFDRQQLIWNEKVNGQRAITDENDQRIDIASMTERELLYALLKYSAIPGSSRHHWGTDLDIFDQQALAAGEALQLLASFYEKKFSRLMQYLYLKDFNFIYPYTKSAIAPEPWHISFQPQASIYQKMYSYDLFIKNIQESAIALKDIILQEADYIYQNYIFLNG